jgi:hypothetical protein
VELLVDVINVLLGRSVGSGEALAVVWLVSRTVLVAVEVIAGVETKLTAECSVAYRAISICSRGAKYKSAAAPTPASTINAEATRIFKPLFRESCINRLRRTIAFQFHWAF